MAKWKGVWKQLASNDCGNIRSEIKDDVVTDKDKRGFVLIFYFCP